MSRWNVYAKHKLLIMMNTFLKSMKYPATIALAVLTYSCSNPERKDRDEHASHIIDSIADTTQRAHAQTADVALTGNEKNFLLAAAMGGMMEVEAANIALQQSADPAIKAFASKMIADHSVANQELSRITDEVGMALPKTLGDDHASHLRTLKTLKEKKFDEQYMTMMLKDHKVTMELLTEGKALKNASIQSFAQKTLPVVTAHFNEAVKIGKTLNLSNTGNGDDPLGKSPAKGSTD